MKVSNLVILAAILLWNSNGLACSFCTAEPKPMPKQENMKSALGGGGEAGSARVTSTRGTASSFKPSFTDSGKFFESVGREPASDWKSNVDGL